MTEPKLYPYTLEWEKGRGFRLDADPEPNPEPVSIKALHDDAAFEQMAEVMAIKLKDGRPTEGDFFRAGGKAFYRGTRQIFPPVIPFPGKQEIVVTLCPTRNPMCKAVVEGLPACWATGSSIYEAVGDLVMHHGDKLGVTTTVIEK